MEFKNVCKDFPKFLTYVESTVLDVVKDKIVRAWTYHVLRLGCRTTNRVEGAHAIIKKYLSNNVGDLGTCWEKIHDIFVIQLTVIQTSFGRSCTVLEHRFKDVILYSGLGVMCLDMLWATLFWKNNVARKHYVCTMLHRMGYHVHASLL